MAKYATMRFYSKCQMKAYLAKPDSCGQFPLLPAESHRYVNEKDVVFLQGGK